MKILENKKLHWLEQFLNSSHIGVLVVDKNRNNLLVNKHLCTMFGYSQDELLAANAEVFHVNHDTFLKFAELAFDFVLKGKPVGIDYQFKKKDGTLFWIHIAGDVVADQEEVLWTMVDITKRVNAEDNIIKLNERMELALLGNHDGLFDLNLIDNSVYYSPRWKEMLGYRDDELLNEVSTWEALVHPEDKDIVWTGIKKHINGETEYYDGAHRLKHKDGHWVWVQDRAKAIYDDNGKAIRLIGTHTDITAEKEVQFSLQKSNNLLEKLSNNIPAAIYQYQQYSDGRASFPYASIGIEDIYEVTPEAIIDDAQAVFDIIHPDDLNMIVDSINNSADTMEDWNLEYRVNLPKKGLRWLQGQAKPEKLEDGSTLWHGFIDDITERKTIEDALQEQHKYLQSIIDGVDDPIMVIKEDYSVELMNETLQKTVKDIQVADPKHPKCYEISHHSSTPCDGANHPCPLRDVMDTKMHTTVVHNHDGMNGEKSYVELSVTPLFDKDKNCIGIIESARDITAHLEAQDELREQKNVLHYQANHDSLTGLANRVLFNDRLEQAIEKAKRSETNLALLFIDLDHFKEINDSLGHDVGDEILKVVASRLRETIRDEDTLARLGGDEFTIIIENLAQGQDASLLAQKIINVLSEVVIIEDHELYVSSSIGISLYPTDGGSASNLLKYADSAMYKAKDNGRNNFQFYSAEMTELAFERVIMETALRSALINEEFVVYYQLQVDATTNTLTGMEALVRWQHPTMGLIPPGKFIPLAENTGLVVEIDQYVMRKAMKQMTAWINQGLNPGILYMNLAVKQLQKKDFIKMLKSLIKETECKPMYLGLEVTESQIMTNPEEAIVILNRVSDMGIELAVDDFGTGYSSLSYLKKLPIDKLKIDQSFVRDLPNDEEDAAITKAVIALAQSLNLKIIAEGVETKEQKEFLVQNGCKDIQGYYYFKPLPANEMENILVNGCNPREKSL